MRTNEMSDGSSSSLDSTEKSIQAELDDMESLLHFAQKANVPFVDLATSSVDATLVHRFPAKDLIAHQVLPLELKDRRLRLAVADPFKLSAMVRHPLFAGYLVQTVLADEEQINSQLKRLLGVGTETIDQLVQSQPTLGDKIVHTSSLGFAHEDATANDEASVSRYVDELLREAVEQRASDLHLEADEDGLRIRFRIDGFLRLQSVPEGLHQFRAGIVSRLKIMAGLNIAEKRLPQDGRFELKINSQSVDVRTSIMPMIHGEEVALRLVDKSRVHFDFETIGFPEAMLVEWKQLIRRPHGMLLVTGPTGSGKTTTLYTSLQHIQSASSKIVTVEDPVEHALKGINQIQVHEKIGLTFSECLRRLLRHDPDVMLIGEIRDTDTARNAIQASLTGHLVLSTLHANDSSSAYTRLVDMGIEPYLVASTVAGVLSQRLVRRLCTHCRESYVPHRDELPNDFASRDAIYRSVGCKHCYETGFAGRVALFELLVPSEETRRLISQNAVASVVRGETLSRGMTTLRHSGWQLVRDGVTTMNEVLRVCEQPDVASESVDPFEDDFDSADYHQSNSLNPFHSAKSL